MSDCKPACYHTLVEIFQTPVQMTDEEFAYIVTFDDTIEYLEPGVLKLDARAHRTHERTVAVPEALDPDWCTDQDRLDAGDPIWNEVLTEAQQDVFADRIEKGFYVRDLKTAVRVDEATRVARARYIEHTRLTREWRSELERRKRAAGLTYNPFATALDNERVSSKARH